jgi:hypothetical protein
MMARIGIFLFLVFACGGLALAQTPARLEEPALETAVDETAVAETGDETSEEAKDEEKVELPDIDVWSSEDEDDDVFVPTESISADASIAFPVDI